MSNAIKHWREKHDPKVTQRELAEQIKLDRPMLSKMESNIIDPNEDMALAISRILGVLVTDILTKHKQ